ncbi:hypothetical protein NEUTE2DRAFT_71179 [Neurospora tetrasperma FGSC 2509]|nr:hypothetical protein NEUTE2DRAFT_71179 [Neurospora tetrasperma FGSC 2509]
MGQTQLAHELARTGRGIHWMSHEKCFVGVCYVVVGMEWGIGEQVLPSGVVNEETPKQPAYQASTYFVLNGSTFNVLRFFRHSLRTYLTRWQKENAWKNPGSHAVASESYPVG